MGGWSRRHALAFIVGALGLACFALFTWSEYGYNAASNWQSELLFGILLVVLLHKVEGRNGNSET